MGWGDSFNLSGSNPFVSQLCSTTTAGSVSREYVSEWASLGLITLTNTVWSPRLRLEGSKREERSKSQPNKQKDRYPGSQGDRSRSPLGPPALSNQLCCESLGAGDFSIIQ